MMKKKRKNFSGMGMGMGMMKPHTVPNHPAMGMGMGMKPQSQPTPNPPKPVNNPILLLNSYTPLHETSVVNQSITSLTIHGSGITDAIQSSFALIVNVVIYAPNTALDPMAVTDEIPPGANGSLGQTRIYNKAFQFGFGQGGNAYQHAMFYLSGIGPVGNTLNITIKHPPCLRRIVTVDEFANISANNPLDQQAARQTKNAGQIQVNSGMTALTNQAFELVYGSVAIGRDFNQYSEPQGFIPIQSVGSNIDTFDATLKTYYKLTAQEGQYGLSALISGPTPADFVWSAAVQTFAASQL